MTNFCNNNKVLYSGGHVISTRIELRLNADVTSLKPTGEEQKTEDVSTSNNQLINDYEYFELDAFKKKKKKAEVKLCSDF